MIVLDTNIASESEKPRPDANVIAWLRRQAAGTLFLCGPVVMERSYGAERFFARTGSDKFLRFLDNAVSHEFQDRILAFDAAAPRLAGKLRARRDGSGRPISVQDAMIAAICLVHGATLATRNVRDFDGLDLKLVNPFEAAA